MCTKFLKNCKKGITEKKVKEHCFKPKGNRNIRAGLHVDIKFSNCFSGTRTGMTKLFHRPGKN